MKTRLRQALPQAKTTRGCFRLRTCAWLEAAAQQAKRDQRYFAASLRPLLQLKFGLLAGDMHSLRFQESETLFLDKRFFPKVI
jgi:hypothetical protein